MEPGADLLELPGGRKPVRRGVLEHAVIVVAYARRQEQLVGETDAVLGDIAVLRLGPLLVLQCVGDGAAVDEVLLLALERHGHVVVGVKERRRLKIHRVLIGESQPLAMVTGQIVAGIDVFALGVGILH